VIHQVDSGSLPSSGANVTNWKDFKYGLMTGPPPPGYTLIKACTWITGDRQCGSFSECAMSATADNVTLSFALQGHNEGDPSVRNSEGHISVAYQLREVRPALKAIVRDPPKSL
jgi:hypothetical protein